MGTDTPEKISANEILQKHGPAGWLVRRLQRYAMLGWVLAFIILFMFFITTVVRMLAPQPVVVVDASGRIIGTLEYLKPTSRSDQEIIDATKRFAQLYMSLNSATIYVDYADAMNMMGKDFLAITEKTVMQDNYLTRVQQARTRSWLEFKQIDGAKIVDRRNLNALVRLSGNIVVDSGNGRIEKPFDVSFETQAVARNTKNTSGIEILSRKDN